jgi:hypothetical protein
MSDEPDSLALRDRRRIDETIDRVKARLPVSRTGLLEQDYARVSRRLDQPDLRIERIEHRVAPVGGHIS